MVHNVLGAVSDAMPRQDPILLFAKPQRGFQAPGW
jgi:hypothetical protein